MSTPITDADLDYLRNIDTRPGPNAGRSIDPTKPGPDADRIAESISRRIAECKWEIEQYDHICKMHVAGSEQYDKAWQAKQVTLAELARLRNEQPLYGDCPPEGYPTDKTRCEPCPRRNEQPKGGDALLAEGLPPFKPCAYIHEAANFTEILLEDCGTVTREQGVREVALLYSFDRERIVGMRMYGKPAPSPATSVEPQDVRERLRYLIINYVCGCDLRPIQRAHDTTEALADALLSAFPALAQSDADPTFDPVEAAEVDARSIDEANERLAQSDAQPRKCIYCGSSEDRCIVDFEAQECRNYSDTDAQSAAQPVGDEFSRGYDAGWRDREARDPLGANRTSFPAVAPEHSPDASGLIEAAEWHQEKAADYERQIGKAKGEGNDSGLILGTLSILRDEHTEAVAFLRARAADKSAPRSDKGGADG